MSPEAFIAHWSPGGGGYAMSERAGAQPHFIGLCALLGVPAPDDADNYSFEFGAKLLDGKRGFADVFKRGVAAWEYKQPGGDLVDALRRLKDYASALDNPPLLVVCDRMVFRIYTQFTGRPTEIYEIALKELADPAARNLLRRAFSDPASFQPRRTNRDITEEAAKAFADVAERMRHERREPPERVAHFLTQCLFCFFAEDVGLLPERLFEKLVAKQITPEKLRSALIELFEKMQRGGLFGLDDIPCFNGGLFKRIDVPLITPMDVAALKTASQLNWSAIDVAIFGTLFERGLDPKKRSQLGAHYTDPATIMRIVTPVVDRPLRAEWAAARDNIAKIIGKSKKHGDAASLKAKAALVQFLDRLATYRVLDPACGSGNFLYLALKTLKDIEHSVHVDAQALGLERPLDLVTSPANVLGIELNEYAAELARVTVWIGELQWRLAHGYPFKQNPVLEPLDHIECRDALLTVAGVDPSVGDADTSPTCRGGLQQAGTMPPLPQVGEVARSAGGVAEATWPRADAVIGNPPFVGDKKMRAELGDEYTETLRKVYEGRVPGGADLVCFWFEKARAAIEHRDLNYAGLVATNSIRGGKNRVVLDAIVESARIFDAWSDEPWVNDGAAVRVSLVSFVRRTSDGRRNKDEPDAVKLDGHSVPEINADLTAFEMDGEAVDLTNATRLQETTGTCFVGTSKKASFDVDGLTARRWLQSPNPDGRSNAAVLALYLNAADMARRSSDTWIIDFGVDRTESDSKMFEKPFEHAYRIVLPEKLGVRNVAERTRWWLHARAAPDMREAIAGVSRFVATGIVSKWRLWTWQHPRVLASHACAVVARADDTTFGILHSRFHELWSLRMCTWLGVGNDPRYTPTTCFETFPFPEGLTPRDTAHQRTETLADGAVIPADVTGVVHGSTSSPRTERVGSAAFTPELVEESPRTGEPVGAADSPNSSGLRDHAIAIARAAKRLNDLRERWLNPPEWTERVPEVVPLGMDTSPYPDRILPKAGLAATELAELKKRTLTNLYNARPAWLADAHAALDAAVAAAYGWADYTNAMPDSEILARLLALNQARAAQG